MCESASDRSQNELTGEKNIFTSFNYHHGSYTPTVLHREEMPFTPILYLPYFILLIKVTNRLTSQIMLTNDGLYTYAQFGRKKCLFLDGIDTK